MIKFKIGDKVKCINNFNAERFLKVGKIYTIKQTFNQRDELIELEEIDDYNNGFYSHRFIFNKYLLTESDYLDAFQRNFKGDEYE